MNKFTPIGPFGKRIETVAALAVNGIDGITVNNFLDGEGISIGLKARVSENGVGAVTLSLLDTLALRDQLVQWYGFGGELQS